MKKPRYNDDSAVVFDLSRLCRRCCRIQTRLMAGGSADAFVCLPLLTFVKFLRPDIGNAYAPSLLIVEVINKA